MKLKTILFSLLTVSALTACEDLFEDGSMQPDGSTPSVTVHAPSNNQSVVASQGMQLDVTIVDKDLVKELDVTVKGENAESALMNFKRYPAKNVVEVDTLLSFTGVAPGAYTLYIKATDRRTNVEQQEIKFTVK
ncbi:hypothetical protein ACFSRY_06650 [Pontibacter locisalis]|uniref:DUF4625 domain-containing protein n=1 Tax=Pontibacter locisalis TaxID=1719035 RepID=A0ABW5IJF6_9BACT